MPTVLKIFNNSEILSFDAPPRFTGVERKKFFRLSKNMQKILDELRTPTNKIGFILQFGYFKATNRFVRIRESHKEDILFICRNFNILSSDIQFDKYTSETFNRHRRIFLKNFGFKEFNEKTKAVLINEALALCSTLKKPRVIFLSLIEWLGERKVECPRYFTIAEIITNALKEFEHGLLSSIEEKITAQEKSLLDNLLEVNETYLAEARKDLKFKRYNITFLKKNNQSLSPQKIKKNIKKLQMLKETFEQIYPIFERLGLDSRTIDYYANISIKSEVFQISRRSKNKYLLLIAFVVHQYYTLNDLLIDILIHACQKVKNTARNKHKEQCYDRREGNDARISMITKKTLSLLEIIKLIAKIIYTPNLSESRMIKEIRALLPQKEPDDASSLEEEVERMANESRTDSDKDYYKILADLSLQTHYKVSDIIKIIEFDEKTSNKNIIKAINYYKAIKGKIDQDAPLGHLDKAVLKYVFEDEKIQKPLYKILFFDAVASNIKSGALNLKYSYKYRPFENYLIPFSSWSSNKDDLIERAGLSQFKNFTEVMNSLRPMLEDRYRSTNENILNEKNSYVKFNAKGQCMVSTPAADTEEADKLTDYFPKDRYITLFEVLSTVDNVERFTDCFEYWQVKHTKKKPSKRILYAGIIGHGCNLGINRIARSSPGISAKELENINTWYFGVNNINNANNKILNIIEQLHLPNIYQRDPSKVHTSSDGQKLNVSVDSMNANYSFKYFGKGKGVNVW